MNNKYTIIDLFDDLDVSLLEGLNLNKDLKRQRRAIQRFLADGHVKIASCVAGIGLVLTGLLILTIHIHKRNFRRIV